MIYFRQFRDHLVKKYLKKYNFQSNMIDIGCGTGEILLLLKDNYDIEGIDISEKAVEICKQQGLQATETDIYHTAKKYNSVICLDVLEHIEDDLNFLRQIKHILNREGKLLLLVPSGQFASDDVYVGHYRRYSKEQLIDVFNKSGFEILEAVSMGYPLIYFLRKFLITFFKRETEDNMSIVGSTKRSSYDHPYDDTVFSRLLKYVESNQYLNKCLLGLFLSQHLLFHKSNKAFSFIIVAKSN